MTTYFTRNTLRFLDELASNNDREWFAAHKTRYEQHVRDPFLRLIGDLQGPLARVSTRFQADPKPSGGSLFRIYRDTRFSNDKPPYKTWQGARFPHERRREAEAPSFYVHIQPGQCFVGAGLWHPQPQTQHRIRTFLADNPAAWIEATRSAAFRKRFEVGGETLKRPPRGFDASHPLIDDIKRKDFTAWTPLPNKVVTSAELPAEIDKAFRGMAPMVDYLCAALELEF